jgi:ribonuclease HI
MARPAGAVSVYTDGACSGNPGPGGWAWAIDRDNYASGSESPSTNQRMEIRAALEAVTTLDGPLVVVSDSAYVVNCFRDQWWDGWIKRGWVNSQKKPVINRDLWEPLVDAVNGRGNVAFQWVKGHSGHEMNDFVDQLAVGAIQRTGTGTGGRPFEAQISGTCSICGDVIEVGQTILGVGAANYAHAECSP